MVPSLRLRELLDADWARLCEVSGGAGRARRMRDVLHPRFAPVALIRIAQRLHARKWFRLAKLASLANFLLFGIEVPAGAAIGPGLVIPHAQGIVMGAGHVGSNVTMFQQVTLGAAMADFGFDPKLRPHVADGVTIASGAKVLGPVRLEAGCTVGANAVVLDDVPEGATAVGVPARIVRRNEPVS